MIKGIPVSALLSDSKLQVEQEIPGDSVTGSFLKPWKEIVRICKLRDASKIMRWCACDTDSAPNRMDSRFKLLTIHLSIMEHFRVLKP